jgi:hypothetical protein
MFIEAEDDPFIVFNRRLHAGNGRKDNHYRESIDDVQPKASIAANTGAGRDVFWDRYSPPYVFLRNASTYPISPTFSARNTEGPERGYLWKGLSRQVDCDPGLLGQRAHVPYRRWRKLVSRNSPPRPMSSLEFVKDFLSPRHQVDGVRSLNGHSAGSGSG